MCHIGRSAAIEVVLTVWHSSPLHRLSWDRFNHALNDAVCLAINAGLEFAPDDFRTLAEKCRLHRWSFGDGNHLGEAFYSLAAARNHVGACRSLEKMMGRKPFFLQDNRIYVGLKFSVWHLVDGKPAQLSLKVTSFSDDHSAFHACSYFGENGWQSTPTRRIKIDRQRLKQYDLIALKVRAYENAVAGGLDEVAKAEVEKQLIAELAMEKN